MDSNTNVDRGKDKNRNGSAVKKAKIMVVMYPEWSAFNATLMLCRQLCNHGCHIVYVGPPKFEEYLKECGFEYRVLREDLQQERFISKIKTEYKKNPGMIRMFRLRQRMRNKLLQDTLTELEEMVSAELPDLVLLDQIIYHYSIPFLKLGIPILCVSVALLSPMNLAVPPAASGMIPGEKNGVFSRIKYVLAWGNMFIGPIIADILHAVILRFSFGFSSYFSANRIIKKYGVKMRRAEYGFKLMLPELFTCPREFDFPHMPGKITRNRCYVGASVYPQRKEKPFYWGEIDKEKPIVYCTLGSYSKIWKYRKRLYHAVIKAVEQRPDWQLILQIADEEDIEDCQPYPRNVFVEKWIPHMQVLPHTSVIICQGGLGTVREAIYFGVPLLIYPPGRDDPGNGARAVFHNLGAMGNMRKVTPGEIINRVDRLMNDPLIRESSKKMEKVFREQENCQAGVDFIETFLSRHRQNKEVNK